MHKIFKLLKIINISCLPHVGRFRNSWVFEICFNNGSKVILKVEKVRFLHITFQHWITFEPFDQNFKNPSILESSHCGKQDIIFNYLIILHFNHLYPLYSVIISLLLFMAATMLSWQERWLIGISTRSSQKEAYRPYVHSGHRSYQWG